MVKKFNSFISESGKSTNSGTGGGQTGSTSLSSSQKPAGIYTWKSYIEAPKRFNLSTKIQQECIKRGLTCEDVKCEDLNRDFIDKMLGINRETIYFTISGQYNTLKSFQDSLVYAIESRKKSV